MANLPLEIQIPWNSTGLDRYLTYCSLLLILDQYGQFPLQFFLFTLGLENEMCIGQLIGSFKTPVVALKLDSGNGSIKSGRNIFISFVLSHLIPNLIPFPVYD